MAVNIRALVAVLVVVVIVIIVLCCWCTGAWKNMYECCRRQNIETDARYQRDVERRRRELELQAKPLERVTRVYVQGEGLPPPYAPSSAFEASAPAHK